MLNLSDFIKLDVTSIQNLPNSNNFNFNDELNICLKSFDFERTETCRFLLCYLSNLLVAEFKTKFSKTSPIILEMDQVHDTLRLFVNKLLNLLADSKNDLKELTCMCLSLIGPIDFKTYNLPLGKLDRFERCLDFPKTYASLRDYSMNINHERRFFILQNLGKYANNQMFQFYYFLIENLLELLFGDW